MSWTFKVRAALLSGLISVGAAQAAAPSGTCGMLLNRQYWGLETVMNNAGTWATHNSLLHVDFDAGVLTYNSVRTSKYGAPDAVTEEVELSIYLSQQPHNSIPNTYKVTLFTDEARSNEVGYLNVMHVNGDATYLVQLVSTKNGNSAVGSGAGVCQRF
jgi:hypothetical protein